MALDQIMNYVQWTDRLGSSGRPTMQQLAQLVEEGINVVINLAMPDIQRAPVHEDFIITSQGITYVHIPVVWEQPTYRDLKHFFAMMDLYAGRRILVHCVKNMRATAFIYLYLTLRRGLSEPQAHITMTKVWRPDAVWQAFIDYSKKRYMSEEDKHG